MDRWQECLEHLKAAQEIIETEPHSEFSFLDSYVDVIDGHAALEDLINAVEWELK